MAAHLNGAVVWQWNCRSYRAKRSNLQLHLQSLPTNQTPTIIALQETQGPAKLLNYTPFETAHATSIRVATLVHRNYTATLHPLEIPNIDGVLVELLPRPRHDTSLFVLNICSPPPPLPQGPCVPATNGDTQNFRHRERCRLRESADALR